MCDSKENHTKMCEKLYVVKHAFAKLLNDR